LKATYLELTDKMKTLLAVVVSGLFAASAGATIYADLENYLSLSSPLGFQVKPSTPLSGEFDLTDYGYNSVAEQVYGALVSFVLWDPRGGTENVSISLVNPLSTIWSGSVWLALTLDTVEGTALEDLSSDGILKFYVTASSGEAYVKGAALVAKAGNRVPDGGVTLTLLGLAFLGILGAQRKFASAG
jgi:hypothetical protein